MLPWLVLRADQVCDQYICRDRQEQKGPKTFAVTMGPNLQVAAASNQIHDRLDVPDWLM